MIVRVHNNFINGMGSEAISKLLRALYLEALEFSPRYIYYYPYPQLNNIKFSDQLFYIIIH